MPQQCSLSRQSRGLALTGQDEQPLPDPSGESLDGRHMILPLLLDHNGSCYAANSMAASGWSCSFGRGAGRGIRVGS